MKNSVLRQKRCFLRYNVALEMEKDGIEMEKVRIEMKKARIEMKEGGNETKKGALRQILRL